MTVKPSYPWLSPAEAGLILGIHHETLRKMIRDRTLRAGVHYRAKNPFNIRPRWQINVETTAEYLSAQTSCKLQKL